ncbi:DUF885 family protein [Persicitalea sp.]|uniref:DUF885 family protein n=1 Tax=Persicitalea sp. TaxID=3100273 RepID=UPI00359415A4
MKRLILIFICSVFLFSKNYTQAQTPATPFDLYAQTSEVAGLILQYGQDIRAIRYFYSPTVKNRYFGEAANGLNSPEQRQRLVEVDENYLKKLAALDFEAMSKYGQVDYILLKRSIEDHKLGLSQEEQEYGQITKYVPFAEPIYQLEKGRRRGATVDGQQVAASLDKLNKEVSAAAEKLKKVESIDKTLADRGEEAIVGLQARLRSTYDFYVGYDPMFSWWVPKPFQAMDSTLLAYAKIMKSKGKLVTTQKEDESGIRGVPIGRQELIRQLRVEMIPYTPEELIALANKEFAWCDKELLKSSQEMGFGNEWKKAQEKVKNSFVPAGQQPELIMKLYNDAKDFIQKNNLIDYPEIADETWGMQMMTPERQLVNPFFLGGRDIIISYPTNTMEHDDKLMSMRGNNPYFSRPTVQHELVPGHHLQYYVSSRYKPYRNEFRTPFWTEGWALYWELLLYDKGFAQTPEERIGMLFWRMHRCARIIFSLNYHLRKWTPQECIDFLVDRVGHERANAEGEVRRSFEGGYSPLYQVAYLIGGLQIFSLKKELVDSGKMTFKQFHDAIMHENSMPIEMVRASLIDQPLTPDYQTKWKFYDFK